MKRSSTIDFIRLFCNLLVVVVHGYPFMYCFSRNSFELRAVAFVVMHVMHFFMPALFLLSGYLMMTNMEGAFWAKVKRRFKRLVVPAVIWNVLYAVAYLLLSHVTTHVADDVEAMQLNTWGGILRQVFLIELCDGPLWYVRAVFVYALATPLLKCLFGFVSSRALVALSVLLVAVSDLTGCALNGFSSYSIACFALGARMAYDGRDICAFFVSRRRLFASLAVVAAVAQFALTFQAYPYIGRIDMCQLLGCPLIWCFSDKIGRLLDGPFVRTYLLPAAFFTYVGHFIVDVTVFHALGASLPRFPGSMTLVMLVAVTATVSAMAVLWRALNRVVPKLLRVLDGRL